MMKLATMAVTQPFWYYINAIFVAHAYFISSVAASNTSCPTWFYFNSTSQQCECGKNFGGIQCNQKEKKVEIKYGTCVTYAGQEGLYYSGGCPYIPTRNNTNRMFSELPRNHSLLNDAMCGHYNREGLLCVLMDMILQYSHLVGNVLIVQSILQDML